MGEQYGSVSNFTFVSEHLVRFVLQHDVLGLVVGHHRVEQLVDGRIALFRVHKVLHFPVVDVHASGARTAVRVTKTRNSSEMRA